MQVLKEFDSSDFERSNSKAYPNLNKIAGVMIQAGAVTPEAAITMTGLHKATGISRSQLDGLIKWRAGFVRVRSVFAGTVRYYYNPVFAQAAKPLGQNFPPDILPLLNKEGSRIAEILFSTVEGTSTCRMEIVHEDVKSDTMRHVQFSILDKENTTATLEGLKLGLAAKVEEMVSTKDPTVIDKALVALLSLRETVDYNKDNIEFWLG